LTKIDLTHRIRYIDKNRFEGKAVTGETIYNQRTLRGAARNLPADEILPEWRIFLHRR